MCGHVACLMPDDPNITEDPLRPLISTLLLLLAGCSGRSLPATADDGSSCPTKLAIQTMPPFACNPVVFVGVTLAVAPQRVLFTDRATLGSNSGSDPDLFAIQTSSGTTQQLTADSASTALLGVDREAVLLAEVQDHDTPTRLALRDGEKVTELGSYLRPVAQPGATMYAALPSHPVSGHSAVWRTEDSIYLYDGSAVRALSTASKASFGMPWIDGKQVVWSSHDGEDDEVYLHDGTTVHRLTDNSTNDRHPALSDGRVFWLCGQSEDAICIWESGASRVLDTGTSCGAPDADDGMASWICDDQVRLFDGSVVRTVTTSSDVSRDGVQLDGGKLLWLEVNPGPISPASTGQLVIWDGAATHVVAQVGLPCIWCNAYYPPLDLGLSDGAIGWSYASPPTYFGAGDAHCGWARLTEACR